MNILIFLKVLLVYPDESPAPAQVHTKIENIYNNVKLFMYYVYYVYIYLFLYEIFYYAGDTFIATTSLVR